MKHNKLKSIQNLGQSIWLDFFDRKMMDSGKLKRLIEEDGIRGGTGNPSMFEKAINASSDYSKATTELSKHKSSRNLTRFTLAVRDIYHTADFFISVCEETNREDGVRR